MVFNTILWVVLAYLLVHLFLFFVVSRIFVPFLGFKKHKLENDIPNEIMDDIHKIKSKTKSKKEFTKEAFLFLSKKFKSLWFHTLLRFDIVFLRDLNKIYQQKDFLSCNSHNHLLRIFLVKSGYYKDSQIEIRHTFLNFGIHQYLRVYDNGDNGKFFDLDLWGHTMGVPIGKHARIFRPSSLLSDIKEFFYGRKS